MQLNESQRNKKSHADQKCANRMKKKKKTITTKTEKNRIDCMFFFSQLNSQNIYFCSNNFNFHPKIEQYLYAFNMNICMLKMGH